MRAIHCGASPCRNWVILPPNFPKHIQETTFNLLRFVASELARAWDPGFSPHIRSGTGVSREIIAWGQRASCPAITISVPRVGIFDLPYECGHSVARYGLAILRRVGAGSRTGRLEVPLADQFEDRPSRGRRLATGSPRWAWDWEYTATKIEFYCRFSSCPLILPCWPTTVRRWFWGQLTANPGSRVEQQQSKGLPQPLHPAALSIVSLRAGSIIRQTAPRHLHISSIRLCRRRP